MSLIRRALSSLLSHHPNPRTSSSYSRRPFSMAANKDAVAQIAAELKADIFTLTQDEVSGVRTQR